jgi:hypothetical protein
MLIAKLAKNLVKFLNLPQSKNQEKPAQKVRNFNSEEIEDIDYKEVKRKNG